MSINTENFTGFNMKSTLYVYKKENMNTSKILPGRALSTWVERMLPVIYENYSMMQRITNLITS